MKTCLRFCAHVHVHSHYSSAHILGADLPGGGGGGGGQADPEATYNFYFENYKARVMSMTVT
jgi:hypothetical protein